MIPFIFPMVGHVSTAGSIVTGDLVPSGDMDSGTDILIPAGDMDSGSDHIIWQDTI